MATTRQNATYLAYVMTSDFQRFALQDGTVGLTSVAVSDDLRLSTDCEPFCEALGSFVGGFVEASPPPPSPASPPPNPCLNRCLQGTCLDVRTSLCSQLLEAGCQCAGCCTSQPCGLDYWETTVSGFEAYVCSITEPYCVGFQPGVGWGACSATPSSPVPIPTSAPTAAPRDDTPCGLDHGNTAAPGFEAY
eukprot:141649-Prymnesium_polylepis.1